MRWLIENLSSLLLALVLALTVWVAAVSSDDPIQTNAMPNPISIHLQGLGSGLVLVSAQPKQATVAVRSPLSVWRSLAASEISLSVDLTGLKPGNYQLAVHHSVDRSMVQIASVDPSTVSVTIEAATSSTLPITVIAVGEPAIGFRSDSPSVNPASAEVVGPTSAVQKVTQVVAQVDLTGRTQALTQDLELQAVDSNGDPVSGVQVTPNTASVHVGIEELGGYRSVVVLPKIEGEVEPGYQLTRITVSPTLVTVFSSDPNLVDQLGGFAETEPVSLTGATADFQMNVGLALPQGVSIVGDKTVTVKVSISPIENSVKVTRRLTLSGLPDGLYAIPSPDTISLILNGPVPLLDSLKPEDVRVVIDLSNLSVGTYQLTPTVVTSSSDIKAQSILPDTVEVVITSTPPPTPAVTSTP